MASNHHHASTVAVTDRTYGFPKAVGNLNIFVDAGVSFTISFDGGDNFLTVPPGFTTIPVGPIKSVVITSDGAFSLVGVQT
jgi:hypothetical protein